MSASACVQEAEASTSIFPIRSSDGVLQIPSYEVLQNLSALVFGTDLYSRKDRLFKMTCWPCRKSHRRCEGDGVICKSCEGNPRLRGQCIPWTPEPRKNRSKKAGNAAIHLPAGHVPPVAVSPIPQAAGAPLVANPAMYTSPTGNAINYGIQQTTQASQAFSKPPKAKAAPAPQTQSQQTADREEKEDAALVRLYMEKAPNLSLRQIIDVMKISQHERVAYRLERQLDRITKAPGPMAASSASNTPNQSVAQHQPKASSTSSIQTAQTAQHTFPTSSGIGFTGGHSSHALSSSPAQQHVTLPSGLLLPGMSARTTSTTPVQNTSSPVTLPQGLMLPGRPQTQQLARIQKNANMPTGLLLPTMAVSSSASSSGNSSPSEMPSPGAFSNASSGRKRSYGDDYTQSPSAGKRSRTGSYTSVSDFDMCPSPDGAVSASTVHSNLVGTGSFSFKDCVDIAQLGVGNCGDACTGVNQQVQFDLDLDFGELDPSLFGTSGINIPDDNSNFASIGQFSEEQFDKQIADYEVMQLQQQINESGFDVSTVWGGVPHTVIDYTANEDNSTNDTTATISNISVNTTAFAENNNGDVDMTELFGGDVSDDEDSEDVLEAELLAELEGDESEEE